MEVKAEVKGTPLPQRANQANNANSNMPPPNTPAGGGDNKKNMRGGGGGGQGGQKRGGNRFGNRGGNNNRGNRNNNQGNMKRSHSAASNPSVKNDGAESVTSSTTNLSNVVKVEEVREAGRNINMDANSNIGSGGGPNNIGGGIGIGNDRGNNNMRNDRGGGGMRGGGGGDRGMNHQRKNEEFMIGQKLKNITGPCHDLPELITEEVKFSGRNRLYIGNLTNDVTEDELREMFKPFGEISESFINTEKNFAFVKVDYHLNAEKAKRELDGAQRKNRTLRIRFAPNATSIRVKNLTPHVSNELLYRAFEIFGLIERAVIIVDDRGKPTGEGLVEYARKSGAMTAMRYCSEKCFFLTSSLRPCVVDPFDHIDDTDGYPEKSLNRRTQDYVKARNNGPRFAESNSFEHEYGTRWKQLHELYKQKQDALKREMQMDEEKLEHQMEYARYEHETEMLRDQLRMREQDRDRQKIEWDLKERQAEEQRTREEENMRRAQDEMQLRMCRQDEELRRRQQENTLFMQAQQLNSLLDQAELGAVVNLNVGGSNGGGGNNSGNGGGNNGGNNRKQFNDMRNNGNFDLGNMNNQDSVAFNFDQMPNNRQNRFDGDIGGGNNGGNGGQGNNRRQWGNDRRDDFQNKRRRY